MEIMEEVLLNVIIFNEWLEEHETTFAFKVGSKYEKKITATFTGKYKVYYNKKRVLETDKQKKQ